MRDYLKWMNLIKQPSISKQGKHAYAGGKLALTCSAADTLEMTWTLPNDNIAEMVLGKIRTKNGFQRCQFMHIFLGILGKSYRNQRRRIFNKN